MYIVIVGAGKVGAQTARELVAFGHEVTVLERDATKVNDLNEELGRSRSSATGRRSRFNVRRG